MSIRPNDYASVEAQAEFLRAGGTSRMALLSKYKSGELTREYVHQEYPKALSFPLGMKTFDCSTETIKGTTVSWTEERAVALTIFAASFEEEEEARALVDRAEEFGIEVQQDWDLPLLRHKVARAAGGKARVTRKAEPSLQPPETPAPDVSDRLTRLEGMVERLVSALAPPPSAAPLSAEPEPNPLQAATPAPVDEAAATAAITPIRTVKKQKAPESDG